jgi:hypothetical protein
MMFSLGTRRVQKDLAGGGGVRAHLVQPRGLDAVEVFGFDHEGRQPLGTLWIVRVGIVDHHVGHVRVGNPGLGAVEQPVVALVFGRGFMAMTSEPASDSVMPKPPTYSAVHQLGDVFFFQVFAAVV